MRSGFFPRVRNPQYEDKTRLLNIKVSRERMTNHDNHVDRPLYFVYI